MNGNKEKKEKSYAGTTRFALILRVIAAVYLLYITFTILQGYMDGDGIPFYLLVTVLVVFTGIGVFVLVKAVKSIVKGEYSGGKADNGEFDKDDVPESIDDVEYRGLSENDGLLSDRLKKFNECVRNKDADDADND